MRWRECSTRAALAEELAETVAGLLKDGSVLAVPGGTTPVPFFAALRPKLKDARITVTLTDERADGSNELLVREHLLTPHTPFVPLKTHDVEATGQALAALKLPFAAVILGMGEDGHVASLFPRHAALAEGFTSRRHCMAVHGAPKPPPERISLTYACLTQANALFLLVTGKEKRATLERALTPGDATEYPVRAFLQQTQVPLTVYWAA